MQPTSILAIALAAASFTMLSACESDQSAPSRPRTKNILTPDNKADENAFQRENEAPRRNLPTSGKEFPGQSQAPSADARMITADARNVDPGRPIPVNGTDSRHGEPVFNQKNMYPGPLPTLSAKAGAAPAPGSTPVPGTAWSVDHSWGEVLPLENYPHRDWAATQTTYVAADVKHNPVYFTPIQPRLNVPQTGGTYGGDMISELYEIPWFGVQTLLAPLYMICEPPLKQVTTQRLGHDPVYLGHSDASGPIVPAPMPGVIRWEYPFLVNTASRNNTTQPATQPIAPTPGITPAPFVTDATTEPAPSEPPTTTPGLR